MGLSWHNDMDIDGCLLGTHFGNHSASSVTHQCGDGWKRGEGVIDNQQVTVERLRVLGSILHNVKGEMNGADGLVGVHYIQGLVSIKCVSRGVSWLRIFS
jgi:hypothetical protein